MTDTPSPNVYWQKWKTILLIETARGPQTRDPKTQMKSFPFLQTWKKQYRTKTPAKKGLILTSPHLKENKRLTQQGRTNKKAPSRRKADKANPNRNKRVCDKKDGREHN